MIYDKLAQSGRYPFPELFRKAFEHSRTLSAASKVGKIKVSDDGLTVGISEYMTLPIGEAKAETHKKYIDIQIVLSGRETIIWQPAGALPVCAPYDSSCDAAFYKYSPQPGSASLDMVPGVFAVFFPWDIHLTQVKAGDKSAVVKKAVYKVDISKVGEPFHTLFTQNIG